METVLRRLGIEPANPAGYCAPATWLAGAEPFPSHNPATGEPIATVGACTPADYETVIAGSCRVQREWCRVPAPKRGEVIRAIGDVLRAEKDALGTLVSLETGKIKQEGDGEVQEMIDIADFAVGQSRMLYGRTMPSERAQHRMFEQWHPLGLVGVITAFNFPVAVWAWNAFLSAVCGNVTVWKPSPKAPLSALAVQRLVNQVLARFGYDGVFTLLIDSGTAVAERLAADPRINLLSFTGSSAVGRRVAQAVAARMGKCLLECSGNNAVIVDETADLKLAIPAIVFGAVGTAGQRCTTTRRLIVHASRLEEVIARLIDAYRQVRIGDPLDPTTLMGPLIDGAAVERFRATLAEIRAVGGEVLYGGEVLPGPGFYVQPTLVRAENHWPVVQRETFAPILYVIIFRSLEEAIQLNNGVPQGLSSALFTADLRRAEQFLSAEGSDCGIANVNLGTSGAEIGGAFGGEKETGGGREAGSDAWKAYMRRQTNTINWGSALPLAQGIRFELGEGGTGGELP
ncbi:L-piperidine-6-carboxylate dehydrogenase [Pelomicrobium sp.]|jgi:aldehyde dehydrogenase (NAD+)|uniref:L-piperidine-6-carboxylate dehydrogenase n=1 Tax=Pelomicrobium sp. TaxID=2815319 RepID=UPI002FDF02A2